MPIFPFKSSTLRISGLAINDEGKNIQRAGDDDRSPPARLALTTAPPVKSLSALPDCTTAPRACQRKVVQRPIQENPAGNPTIESRRWRCKSSAAFQRQSLVGASASCHKLNTVKNDKHATQGFSIVQLRPGRSIIRFAPLARLECAPAVLRRASPCDDRRDRRIRHVTRLGDANSRGFAITPLGESSEPQLRAATPKSSSTAR